MGSKQDKQQASGRRQGDAGLQSLLEQAAADSERSSGGRGLCRATVRGERCVKLAIPGKPLCGKHLQAARSRDREARDKAELERMELARSEEVGATGPRPGSVSYGKAGAGNEVGAGLGVDVGELEARWWTGSEILSELVQAKYNEVLRLRKAANAGKLLITEIVDSESALRGRDRRVKETPALAHAWAAERDLVKMLSVSVGADLEEAEIRSRLRTNKEYMSDIREAMMLARTFPDVGVDQLIMEQAKEARRRRGGIDGGVR